MKTVNKFLLGADPEFVALQLGKHLNCAGLLGANDPTFGELAYDHSGDVGELNPKPERTVYALLRNMKGLLKHPSIANLKADALVANSIVTWEGYGRQRVSLGGHIHFGLCGLTLSGKAGMRMHGMEGYREAGKLEFTDADALDKTTFTDRHYMRLKALDHLTKTLEDIAFLPTSKTRRHDYGYGRYSQFRAHENRTEYRAMGSWLFDPLIADLCLTGAKLVVHSPAMALTCLEPGDRDALNLLFETYASRDDDAMRVAQLLSTEFKPGNPKEDFRPRWEAVSYVN